MTRITVHIEGENAQEVHEALAGMAGLRPAAGYAAASAADVEAKIAAANATPLIPDTGGTKTETKAKAVKAEPKPKATEADVFADQVKRATAEEQADEAKAKADAQSPGEVTFKMVQDALAAYSSKNSMIKAREVLATFKNVEGGPVARISEVQPADFGDVLAKLSA